VVIFRINPLELKYIYKYAYRYRGNIYFHIVFGHGIPPRQKKMRSPTLRGIISSARARIKPGKQLVSADLELKTHQLIGLPADPLEVRATRQNQAATAETAITIFSIVFS
jgi:hypothetical protein